MPMRRARRLVSVAVVASLAVTGLSACRSAPAMAAYVGDVNIAETRAQSVYDEVHNAILAGTPGMKDVTRADVVGVLVGAELLPGLAKQHGVSLPADLQVENYAKALRLPTNTEYTRLYAEASEYAHELLPKVTPAPTLTDADLREIYDAVVVASGGSGGTTFEQFKSTLSEENKHAVQLAVGLRNEIGAAATKADLRINPRFQPASLPVLQTQGQTGEIFLLMKAPLAAEDKAPVSAAPASSAPASPAP
jgi:hypothetical protein